MGQFKLLFPASVFLFLIQSILAQGEITPVQAKQIRTMYFLSGDTQQVVQRWRDTRLRNSHGALYEKSEMLDENDEVVKTAITLTEPDGIQYTINESKKAILIERSPLRRKIMNLEYSPSLERREYLGRICVVLPLNAPAGSGRSGEVWVDEATNFLLYRHTEISSQNRKQIRTIETIEFITGVEPSWEYFKPPNTSGYEVIDKLQAGR